MTKRPAPTDYLGALELPTHRPFLSFNFGTANIHDKFSTTIFNAPEADTAEEASADMAGFSGAFDDQFDGEFDAQYEWNESSSLDPESEDIFMLFTTSSPGQIPAEPFYSTDTAATTAQNDIDESQGIVTIASAETVNDEDGGSLLGTRKQICFGMIHNVPALLIGDVSRIDTILDFADSNYECRPIDVVYARGCLVLNAAICGPFAILSQQISSSIVDSLSKGLIQVRVIITPESAFNIREHMTKRGRQSIVILDLNVYGDRNTQSTVSSEFSKARVFLQDPDYIEQDIEYDNPHCLALPPPDPSMMEVQEDVLTTEIPKIPASSEIMNSVYDSLSRSLCLESYEADSRVKTTLFPHQKEALHFMSQREFGPVLADFSLWKYQYDHGQVYYENIITGTTAPKKPLETGYGLLADDMGLGKSLSTLAMIARTTQEGYTYSGGSLIEETSDGTSVKKNLRSRATLIIVPSALLIAQWSEQIDKHLTRTFKFYKYHGRNRTTISEELLDNDVVLTTYSTLSAEYKKGNLCIQQISWFRIVLDEAHTIRQHSARLTKAVVDLSAHFRWCLTGTPIQNDFEDLGALLLFLRPNELDSLSAYRKHVVSSINQGGDDPFRKLRVLLDSICLRRTKNILKIPEISERVVPLTFSPAEMNHYQLIQSRMAELIRRATYHENSSHKKFGDFQMQLRLRRLCNHGTYDMSTSEGSSTMSFNRDQQLALLQQEIDAKCSRCRVQLFGFEAQGGALNVQFTVCGEILCLPCREEYSAAVERTMFLGGIRQCPLCRSGLEEDYFIGGQAVQASQSITQVSSFREDGISTKISRLIQDLRSSPPDSKSIVFSCWTASLDLIAKVLELEKISFRRIDGSVGFSKRQSILNDFSHDRSIPLLLMTTGTGAVGLNLSSANYVYIFEPQWNPAVESQAIARAVRLGQQRPVTAVRYFIERTFEENMRNRQMKKIQDAEMGWG